MQNITQTQLLLDACLAISSFCTLL